MPSFRASSPSALTCVVLDLSMRLVARIFRIFPNDSRSNLPFMSVTTGSFYYAVRRNSQIVHANNDTREFCDCAGESLFEPYQVFFGWPARITPTWAPQDPDTWGAVGYTRLNCSADIGRHLVCIVVRVQDHQSMFCQEPSQIAFPLQQIADQRANRPSISDDDAVIRRLQSDFQEACALRKFALGLTKEGDVRSARYAGAANAKLHLPFVGHLVFKKQESARSCRQGLRTTYKFHGLLGTGAIENLGGPGATLAAKRKERVANVVRRLNLRSKMQS
jgi:hypothetical protein